MLSSMAFVILGLMFRSLIYFELIFEHDLRIQLHFFFFCKWISAYQAPFVVETWFFPIDDVSTLVSDHLTI